MAPATTLVIGEWGGDQADVTASATTTRVTLNCSFGDFPGNISLDANGRFAVDGTYNRSIGPIQVNANMPAQFSGQVTGNSLTFAVAVNDTTAKQIFSLGPATVVLGNKPKNQVCPL